MDALDNLTKAGAMHLAHRIANFWLDRGYKHIEVAVVPVGRQSSDGRHSYGVRSNLDGWGLPPREPRPIDLRAGTVEAEGLAA